MDEFFKDLQQKAIDVLYNVEAAVNAMAPPKRRTTTVRAPVLQQVPIHDCEIEDAVIGVWHYDNSKESFEICYDQNGRLQFKEGKRKGELVLSADGVSFVASLTKQNGKAYGTIKLRHARGDSAAPNRILSNFKPNNSSKWRKEIVSIKRRECSIDHEMTTSGQPVAASSSQSRCVPEDGEVAGILHAKSAPPQELHFVVPADCIPGQKICLLGPHGDPLTLDLPEGAEPGKPCQICLGPKSTYQVAVPEGTSAGSTVVFSGTDGVMFNAVVPPGKVPGDSFDVAPPAVIVQVPPLAKAGDDVTFTTPTGVSAVVEVPVGFVAGHYFAVVLPWPGMGSPGPSLPASREEDVATTMFYVEREECVLQKPMCMETSHSTNRQRQMAPDHTEQDSCKGMPQCSIPRADEAVDIDDDVFHELSVCRQPAPEGKTVLEQTEASRQGLTSKSKDTLDLILL